MLLLEMKEITRALGVKPRDRVTFTIADGEVRLRPASYSLESAYGSVEPAGEPQDFDELSRAARDARAGFDRDFDRVAGVRRVEP